MARSCADVGALVRRSVREGALKSGQRGAAVGAYGGRGRAVCSLEGIGIYQSQSELIGGYRIFSDKL